MIRLILIALALWQVSPLSGQVFEVEGHELRYFDQGEGQPLLLVPGWTQSLETWDRVAETLSDSYRVIRFDRGPYGLTTDPVDVVALLDDLGVRRSIVIGHSVGAATALRFTTAFPDRVKLLVLYGPPSAPGLSVPWNGPDSWPAHLARIGVDEGPFEVAAAHGVDSLLTLAATHPLFVNATEDDEAGPVLWSIWKRYRGEDLTFRPNRDPVAAPPTLEAVQALRVPVLIVTGATEISYMQLSAAVLHYALPNSERVVIPGGGHMVHLQNPEGFVRAVRGFLRRHER